MRWGAALALVAALAGPGAGGAEPTARDAPAVFAPQTRRAVEVVFTARQDLGRHDPAAAQLHDAVEAARRLALAGSDSLRTAPTQEAFATEAGRIRAALAALPVPEADDRRHAAIEAVHDRCQSLLSKLDAAAVGADATVLRQRAAELLADIESDRRVEPIPHTGPTLQLAPLGEPAR